MTATAHFNDDNFATDVMKSKLPVLVDFYATWCGPCQMQGPIVEELAGEYQGKVAIGKLDVDEAGETAGKYQILSIPTIMIFKGGEPVAKLVGFQSKDKLKEELDKVL